MVHVNCSEIFPKLYIAKLVIFNTFYDRFTKMKLRPFVLYIIRARNINKIKSRDTNIFEMKTGLFPTFWAMQL